MMLSQGYDKDIIWILYGCGWEGHPIAIGGKGIPLAIWWKRTLLASVGRAPHCHMVGSHPIGIFVLGIFQGWHNNYQGIIRTP